MTALEELISIIQGFTPEQLTRFSKVVDLMKNMSENELIFTETFLSRIFRGEGI